MKYILFVFLCICSLMITGCGHNNVMHSKGWGIDISWNQDSLIPNLKLGYWDSSFAIVKENVEVDMTSNAGLGADTKNSSNGKSENGVNRNAEAKGSTSNTIKIKTGPQINGYTKDVLTNPNLSKETVEAIKALHYTNSK